MAPKLIQCIKFSFSLTARAIFRWINNKSVPHSSSVFACRRGKNASAPSIVYRLLFGWNCHTTWSQGNLHYMRLHFLKLDWEFFCLQPSLARLYSAAASPSEHLHSDGSLAIIINYHPSLDYTSKRHSCCDNSTLPSLLSQSLSQLKLISLSVTSSQSASQYLFQLSQPVGLLLEVSQTLGKVILSVLLSLIPKASQLNNQPVTQLLSNSVS